MNQVGCSFTNDIHAECQRAKQDRKFAQLANSKSNFTGDRRFLADVLHPALFADREPFDRLTEEDRRQEVADRSVEHDRDELESLETGAQHIEKAFGLDLARRIDAEDILRRNPRFLTRSKSFDTFFSFGPVVVTPDEVDDVTALTVQTIRNGEIMAENVVNNMTFPPFELVTFHSRVMTLEPGDIISTGTPGAVHIRHGDIVKCHIEGIGTLQNPVVDSKH